ncbi:MAG: hypothetical protein LBE84_03650 [Planctomycetota bacterium]|jgi:hypothetical protein|nr:hypothetical protein [Planctomycetota bacterium]
MATVFTPIFPAAKTGRNPNLFWRNRGSPLSRLSSGSRVAAAGLVPAPSATPAACGLENAIRIAIAASNRLSLA